MTDTFDSLKAALADRYVIERELGAGGMATVYLAVDGKHHRQVAVKVLRPELAAALGAERFLREIEIAAGLAHPHILPLYDSGEADGFLYYVMPYVEGESLRDLITRERQLPVDQAVQIAREVADALASAHKRDVVHRDIKPENILLQEEHAVVADFGLARAISAAGGEQLTETGLAVGTPAYMSPEQASADELDGRSDIYALGCVLYEMLAGVPPFTASTPQAVMARHAIDPVPSLSTVRATVPSVVEAAITKALAKVPADRFATAGEFAEALTRTDAVTPTTATPVVAQVPAEPSIAVLPFTNMSPDPENEYFSDGMSEEIINALTQLKGLRVAARTSSFSFKGKSVDIADVGAKLKVETVLEGSVRKAGNKLRIAAQLISVADGYHLWSERYDREMDDVFAIQDEIATAIAEKLKVALVGRADQALVKRPTENLEAYQLYLEGRFYWNRRELRRGLACFERALALDPDYALAHAGVADAYGLLGFSSSVHPREAMPKARQAAARALELDDTLAEAHWAFAYVSFIYDWDWPTAAREFERAIELNPSYVPARYMYAFYLWLVEGRSDEAVAEAKLAVEIDPLASHAIAMLGLILWGAGRAREAIPLLEKAIEQDPAYFFLYRCLGLACQAESMYPEAIAALEQAANLLGREPVGLMDLATTHALSGEPQKAQKILDELIGRSRQEYVSPCCLAMIQLALGRKDEALASLERAYQERDPILVCMKRWPSWQPVYGDPRFESLLRRIGWK
ncbi:MAG: protein kinase [Gemmatimonadales bacterium]